MAGAVSEGVILKWAVGAPVELPQLSRQRPDRVLHLLGVDEDRLLEAASRHRIVGRLLQRTAVEGERWLSRSATERLRAEQERTARESRDRISAVREINALLAPGGGPAIAIKGYSTYALLNEPAVIRPSADLDLLVEDPERLHDVLLRLGYSGSQHAEGHEWATMRRGGITVEIHRFFPVCSYPDTLPRDPLPGNNPGIWVQRGWRTTRDGSLKTGMLPIHRRRTQLHWADLKRHLCRGAAPDLQDVLVLDAAMTVLILCAHLFLDFIAPPFRSPLPMQLSALADIRDLVNSSQFDRRVFRRLVAKYCAHDAVRLVSRLMRTVLGVAPKPLTASATGQPVGWRLPDCWLPGLSSRAAARQLCRSLSFHGCWATVSSPEELLYPLTLSALVERLVPNRLDARAGEVQIAHVGLGKTPSAPPCRVIIQSEEGEGFAFGVRVGHDAERLWVEVLLLEPPAADQHYQIRVDGIQYSLLSHWVRMEGDGRLAKHGSEEGSVCARVEPARLNRGCLISWLWTSFPGSRRNLKSIPLLLRLMRSRGGTGTRPDRCDALIVVPLVVTCST